MKNIYLHYKMKKNSFLLARKQWFISPNKEHKDSYLFSEKDIKKIEEIDFVDILLGTRMFCYENSKATAMKILFDLEYEKNKLEKLNKSFKAKKIYENDKCEKYEEIYILEYKEKEIGIYLNISEISVSDRFYFYNREVAKEILNDYNNCFKENEIIEKCNYKYFCEKLNIEEFNYFEEKVLVKEISVLTEKENYVKN